MEGLFSLAVATVVAVNSLTSTGAVNDVLGTKVAQVDITVDSTNTRSEETQDRIQQVRDNTSDRRENFRQNLQEVRDERKQNILENLADRLTNVNDKWVNHWNKMLARMSEVLGKLEARLASYDGDLDTTPLEEQIVLAKDAIADAQALVDEQADKDYVFEVGDESTLGQDIRSQIAEAKSEINLVWQAVRNAKNEVQEVLVEVRKLTSSSSNGSNETTNDEE